MVGGFLTKAPGVTDGRQQMADIRFQTADGRHQIPDGRSQTADGRNQIPDGRWQMAVIWSDI